MSNDNDIRHGRHCVFKMHVHLVFVAKYRRRVFDADAINRLRTIFAKVCANFEAQLIEMDGEDDQVHLIEKRYWKGVLWSPSYFASSCGGAPISIVRQYIEQQQTPH